MKKSLILTISILFFICNAYSQEFGIKAGVNIANVTVSGEGLDISPDSKIGGTFGPVMNIELNQSFDFNTGILYSLKGFEMDYGDNGIKASIHYIDIPLNLQYGVNMTEKAKLLLQAGPYIGVGVSGTYKERLLGQETKEDLSFGSGDDDDMKRMDFGIGLGIGTEINEFVLAVNYNHGLSNLIPNTEDDEKLKNKAFQFSVTYMF